MIKALRDAMGYTQKEFADIMLTTVTTVYRWESGTVEPTFNNAQVKAFMRELRKLKLSPEDLPDSLKPKAT